jgi:predicted RNA-binding protein YlqC (UPF0109 family)
MFAVVFRTAFQEVHMRDFIEYIAKQLVDNPNDVSLIDEEKEGKIIFKLKVGEADVGKIIGRKGRTAQAMRVLLSAVAAKNGKRAMLEVLD